MPALNVTALTASNGMSQVICVVNDSANGLLTGGLVIALFFIMLLVLKKWEFSKSLLVSSWSSFLVSLFMMVITCPSGSAWINTIYPLTFLLISALSAWYVWSNSDSSP